MRVSYSDPASGREGYHSIEISHDGEVVVDQHLADEVVEQITSEAGALLDLAAATIAEIVRDPDVLRDVSDEAVEAVEEAREEMRKEMLGTEIPVEDEGENRE